MRSSSLMSDLADDVSSDRRKVLSNLTRYTGALIAKLAKTASFRPSIRSGMKDSSVSNRLDRTDLKMLRLLQNNGRLSNAELAETAGVSPATCHRGNQR